MKVTNNAQVSIHYKLYDSAGALVESTYDEEDSICYVQGADEILSGLEEGLEGLEAGAKLKLKLPAEKAYGAHNPDGIVVIPRNELPAEHEYTKGDWISISVQDDEESDGAEHVHTESCDHDDPAHDAEEGEMEARIIEVRDTDIVLDANHPLAGQDVTFEVEVISVESGAD